jgi:uncharacterized protein YecT (DUF1311 family)
MRTALRNSSTAAALLLLAACAQKDGKTDSLKTAVAADTALARDLRKASADTAARREAADPTSAPRPAATPPARASKNPPAPATQSPPMRATKPIERMPPRRTDQTPSIPVNPPVIRGPAPASAPVLPAGAPAHATSYPIDACTSPAADDQRRCLQAYLARSDAPLDRTYQALIADMKREAGTAAGQPEPDAVLRLREAQRAWLVYRDTECRQRGRGQEGALWAPVRAQCLGDFSAKRAAELAGMRGR